MHNSTKSLTGIGIYSVPEASKLTQVSTARIRRWLKGYSFSSKGKRHQSPPVWRGQIESIKDQVSVGFLDLIEIQYVEAFLKQGVSWKTIRMAEDHARKVFNTDHPFCTKRFSTDGCAIFAKMEGADKLLDMAVCQRVFREFVEPFFLTLEFDKEKAILWRPIGGNKHVILDPARCFGQPIVTEGVPTQNLYRAFCQTKSIKDVAAWYEISEKSVRDAIAFEEKLAA